jgi:hypothetical protein
MVEPGTPGLHVCMPDSIHIDPHQTVDGKGWSWSWGSGGPEFGTSCTYSFLAFLGHMMDVEGHRPVNPFTHHGQIVSRINSLLPQLEQRVREFPDISAQRDDLRALQTEMQAVAPILRRWSLQGKEGGDDAEARPAGFRRHPDQPCGRRDPRQQRTGPVAPLQSVRRPNRTRAAGARRAEARDDTFGPAERRTHAGMKKARRRH